MPWLDQFQKDLVTVSPISPKKIAEKTDIALSNIVAALNDRRGIPQRAFPAFMRVLGFDVKTDKLLPDQIHYWIYDGTSEEYEAAYRLTTRFISTDAQVGPIIFDGDNVGRDHYFCPIWDNNQLFVIYRTTIGFNLSFEEAKKYEIWGSKFPFGERELERLYISEFDFNKFAQKFGNMELTEEFIRELIKTNTGREPELIEMTWAECVNIMVENGWTNPRQVLDKLGITEY